MILQKSRDAQMRQLAIMMRTPRTMTALASSWMHVACAAATDSRWAPVIVMAMFWMPSEFVVAPVILI